VVCGMCGMDAAGIGRVRGEDGKREGHRGTDMFARGALGADGTCVAAKRAAGGATVSAGRCGEAKERRVRAVARDGSGSSGGYQQGSEGDCAMAT
jgi:CO dehydrogenase/acetyl-CoA synthase alpha subunit